jgi:hypothetical protein
VSNDSTLLAAARLYQGQTTNFRTPRGGFAPVFFLPPLDPDDGCPYRGQDSTVTPGAASCLGHRPRKHW